MLIASESAYSEGKEYTHKICDKGITNCDECKISKISKLSKISFKVSKSLGSVMQTLIKNDGTIDRSNTIDNCKIFDEDTFECETIYETGGTGSSIRAVLSNGKWERMTRYNRYGEINHYSCGTEIRSIFNPFK